MRGLKFFTGVSVLWVMIAFSTKASAQPLDCAHCHQNPAMTPSLKNEVGVVRSLYIDPDAFEQSWHYKLGQKTQCVFCHKDVKTYPHNRKRKLRCSNCHPESLQPLFKGIEQRVSQSVHNQLDCIDCHDVHRNKPARAMALEEKNQGCLKCHQHGKFGKGVAAIEPISITAYHSWHPQAELHLDRMACIVCHTNITEGKQDKHLILGKENATAECSVCHSGDSKVAAYLIDIGPEEKSGLGKDELLKRIYLVGGTRNKLIEIIGGSFLLLTIIGVFGHGAGRAVFGKRKEP